MSSICFGIRWMAIEEDFEVASQPLLIPSSNANQEEVVFNDKEDIRWKKLGLLMFVWFAFLVIHITKDLLNQLLAVELPSGTYSCWDKSLNLLACIGGPEKLLPGEGRK